MSHPEIIVVTKMDPDNRLALSLASQLLEYGIHFEGLKEQRFPDKLPEDMSVYKAALIDEPVMQSLDKSQIDKLQKFSGEKFLFNFDSRPLADAQGIGPMAKRLNDLFTLNLLHNMVIHADLTVHHPETARIQLERPDGEMTAGFKERLMDFLAKRREWSEFTLHYWKAAARMAGAEGNEDVREALIDAIRVNSQEMPVGAHHDQIAGLFGTGWLAEETGDYAPFERARSLMDDILKRRPRTKEGLMAGAGFSDDPLLLASPQHRTGGDISRREVVWTETLHMTSATLATMTRLTGDDKYADEVVNLFTHLARVHMDDDDLMFHCSRDGRPVSGKWSRGMAHALNGMRYLLEDLPEAHPARRPILHLLERIGRGLERVQDKETGLWRNLLDHPDARLECSGTNSFVSVYARCLKEGWLAGEELRGMVERGRAGLKRLYWRGGVAANCRGTATGDSAYYLGRLQGWVMGQIPDIT